MTHTRANLLALLVAAGLVATAVGGATVGWPTVLLALWGCALLGGVCFLFWVLVFDRFLLPVRDGMRDAEREHRVRRGLCPSCAYDLRATPGRCPECGELNTREDSVKRP